MITPSSVTFSSVRWEAVAMHVAGYRGGVAAERLIDVLPIYLLSAD
jgi:hypothetical protein